MATACRGPGAPARPRRLLEIDDENWKTQKMSAQTYLRGVARRVVPKPFKPPLRQLAIGARERYRQVRFLARRMDARLHHRALYGEVQARLERPDLDARLRSLLLKLLWDRPRPSRRTRSGPSRPPGLLDVVYVTNRLTPDAAKDVLALQERGRMRCAVACGSGLEDAEPLARAGVLVLPFGGPADLVSILLHTPARVIIARRGSTAEAALALLFGSGRFVYRPYDFVARSPRNTAGRALQRGAEHRELERFILRNAAGLVHMHDERTLRHIRREYGFRGVDASVRPGCADAFQVRTGPPKLSDSDHQVHLVHAANLARGGSEGRYGVSDDPNEEFVGILEQGLHLHVFHSPDTIAIPRAWRDLADHYPRFHVEATPAYRELVRRLAQYDFAFAGFPRRRARKLDQFYGGMANAFYTYLDAGLPVIAATTDWPLADLVREHGIGLVVGEQDLPRLRHILGESDRAALQRRLAAARAQLMHDAARLVDFVRSLADERRTPAPPPRAGSPAVSPPAHPPPIPRELTVEPIAAEQSSQGA